MKNLLVTGARGFIGFNAIQLWHKMFPELNIVGLDAETYADKFMIDKKNAWLDENKIPVYKCVLGEENSKDILRDIVKKHSIDTIVNFAAESHVDNSIKNPGIFVKSNVLGTSNVLDICNEFNLRLHHISTDEVIGAISPEMIYGKQNENVDLANEKAMFDPSSPYSSSKASAELVCNSYFKTFGTKVTISRCTNNFGPWQMSEKLLPTVISKAMKNENIPIYADGLQRRFWIYVDEHNKAVMDILQKGKLGETYCIAPKFNWIGCPVNESLMYNIDIVKMVLLQLQKPESLIVHVKDRPAHDNCYFLVADKIKNDCGYEDTSDFIDSLKKTIDWYVENL